MDIDPSSSAVSENIDDLAGDVLSRSTSKSYDEGDVSLRKPEEP